MAATLGARGDRSAVLDAVRAIACVMVFLAHASEYDGDGALIGLKNGVMLFFALSGYLLYRPFLRGPVDLRRYAIHRIARIVPAYVLALVGISLLTGSRAFVDHPLTYLTFSQNYDAGLWQGFLGVSWTLVLEVQFYLVLPVLALVVGRSAPRLLAVAILSFVGAMSAWTWALLSGMDPRLISSLFPFMLWAFIPGMLAALLERPRLGHPVVLAVGIILLAVGTRSLWISTDLASGLGAGLVVVWAAARRPNLGRLVPVATAGAALTYAAYLWHADLLMLTPNVAVAVAATLAVASVSYLAVERPILRWASLRPTPAHRTAEVAPAAVAPS